MNPRPSFLKLRLLRLVSVAFATLLASGCSVDVFSKGERDPGVDAGSRYRTVRPECGGLKLARPELDPKTFRELVACFGANGSLPEITKLIADASESTITQTVELLNATFLADATVRADSRGIVRALKRRGRWDPALAGFAPAFRNSDRLCALIRLLSLGGRDPKIVRTVQSFDAANTLAGFELFSRLVKTRVFSELSRKIQADPLSPADRDRLLEILTELFRRPTKYRSADLLLADMSAGKSAPVWSFAFGDGVGNSVLDPASRFTLLLRDFSAENGIRPLSRMHRGFHHSIACWGEGKVFPDPWRNLAHELGIHAAKGETSFVDFIGRFAPLTALGVPDLCAVPDEFTEYYPAVMGLAQGRSGGEYLGLLERVFAGGAGEDEGFGVSAGYFVGEWGEGIADALAILEPKSWFGDLVLLFGEFDSGDRELVATWAKALLRDRDEWTRLTATWTKADLDPVFADLGRVLGTDPAELAGMLDSIRELFESARVHPWFEGWKKIAAKSDSNGMRSLSELASFPDAADAIGKMAEDGRLAAMLGDILELLAGAGRGETSNDAVVAETSVRKDARHALVGADLRESETWAAIDDSIRACARLDLRKAPTEADPAQWKAYQDCLAGGGVDANAFGGLRTGQAWKIADGSGASSFFDSLLHSVVALPLTTAERRSLIALATGKVAGVPAVTASAVADFLASVRARFTDANGAPATRIFSVLNRLQTGLSVGVETWNAFFARVERAIEDSRFVPLARALRGLVDPAESGDQILERAPEPPAEETATWVRDLECERDGRAALARAGEIGREFDRAVLGWERPGGKLPTAWDSGRLKPRMEAFAESIASPAIRAGLYAWLGSLDPKVAAKWFTDRARDPRLVAVMDPETKRLRVRWMTSLDRLESILVNSDFTYLLNGNYGLKFIGKFAEAWGDEPRARWPREIQEKYRGRRKPPTLAEVYGDVASFLKLFERVGGIPSVPDCVAKDGEVAKVAFDDPWGTAPDLLIPFAVKAKAFNLKQTLSVVRENLPESGAPTAGGMRLLRDVFWAVYSSAPRADRDDAKPERNPLRFFQRLGDLGALRSASRGLQAIDRRSEMLALEDAFAGLRPLVAEPAFERVIAKAIATPEAVDTMADSAFRARDFDFGSFVGRALDTLAADRTLGLAPALARFADSAFGDSVPTSLLADGLARAGARTETETRLRTLRPRDEASAKTLAGFGPYFEARVLDAFRAFPVRGAVALVDRDSVLRADLFAEAERWTSSRARQTAGDASADDASSAALDLLLSADHPEARRATGLWCGRSAGRYAFELSSRPADAALMTSGILDAGRSAVFSDFLEALLRELAD